MVTSAVFSANDMNVACQTTKVRVPQPAGLGFDPTYGGDIDLAYDLSGRVTGYYSYDPFQAAAYVACRNGTQIYFALTGNDTTGNGSLGNPYLTKGRAITAANAGGVPCTVIGVYGAAGYPGDIGGVVSTVPTVDIAFVASGGRVNLGRWRTLTWSQNTGTFTALTGNTNVWAVTRNSFGRAVSPRFVDFLGNPLEYTIVGSVAACNSTPGSVFSDGTTIYCHPFNGEAASNNTIRVYLTGLALSFVANSIPNLFWTGETPRDMWDFEGGFFVQQNQVPGTKRIFAARNLISRAAGNPGSEHNGMCVNSIHGLIFFDRVGGFAPRADSINVHNYVPGMSTSVITLNCRGNGSQSFGGSNNNLTIHEDVIGIEIAGDYSHARGGSVRNIDSSKMLLAGTRVGPDLGGNTDPAAIFASGTAQIWLDQCRLEPGPNGLAMQASSGSAIRYTNMDVAGMRYGGAGTVEAYTT